MSALSPIAQAPSEGLSTITLVAVPRLNANFRRKTPGFASLSRLGHSRASRRRARPNIWQGSITATREPGEDTPK